MQWIRDDQLPAQNEPLNREHVSNSVHTFILFTQTGSNYGYLILFSHPKHPLLLLLVISK